MIETVISLPLIEWVIIFSIFIGFIIYSNWSISKYKELIEENNILDELLNLKEHQLFFNEFGHTFLIMRQISGKPMNSRGITPFKL